MLLKRLSSSPLGQAPPQAGEVLRRALERRLDALQDVPGEAGCEQFPDLVVVPAHAQRIDRVEHRHPLPRLLDLDLLHQDGDRVLVVLPRILARQRHELIELRLGRAAEVAEHLDETRLVRPIERHPLTCWICPVADSNWARSVDRPPRRRLLDATRSWLRVGSLRSMQTRARV